MANVNRAQLSINASTLFPDNTSQLISPQDLRDWLANGIDSFVTQKDKSALTDVLLESNSTAIVAGATANLNLADGNFVHITGVTEINSFGDMQAGSRFVLVFDNAAQIRASSAIIIPGVSSGNLKIAIPGDCCMIISEGSGNWRIVGYFPGAGAGSGTVTDVTASAPLSSTGGPQPDISITQADGSTDGYLSSSDWTKFNGKGDVTASGTPSAGDFAKFTSGTDITTATASGTKKLIGSNDTTTTIQEIDLGSGLSMSGNTLNASGGTGTVFSVATSSPITGGTITGSGTIGIQDAAADGVTKGAATFANTDFQASSGVINLKTLSPSPAGTYTNATVQVDATGRVTNASSGTGGGTVTSSGTSLTGSIAKFTSATDITKAVSGTDYAPATSGTSILKGSGSGGFSNATAGTDYLAPPSGTAIQKANSGGALANATAGTDYVAPGSATTSGLTMNTSKLLGRTTGSIGPIEEITLTTSGTSGPATLTGGNLNIPQYGGGATLTLGSSVVTGANAGRLLLTTTSGANQVLNQDSNLNYDTTNDRLGVGVASPTARFHAASGSGTNGQILLEPSSLNGALTGTTDGTIWYDTTSNNSSLYLRKLYAAATSILTKFITLDRNPDFATGSSSGIVISDSNGSLTKSADLTPLGIYAETAGTTVQNTNVGTSIVGTVVGSTTLPANFFGVGKTIRIFASGTYRQTSGTNTCTLLLTIGGVSMGSIALTHSNAVGPVYWEAEWNLTCRTSGTSGTVQYTSKGILNTSSISFYLNSAATSGSINTTTSNSISINATWSTADSSNILVTSIHYANYIN